MFFFLPCFRLFHDLLVFGLCLFLRHGLEAAVPIRQVLVAFVLGRLVRRQRIVFAPFCILRTKRRERVTRLRKRRDFLARKFLNSVSQHFGCNGYQVVFRLDLVPVVEALAV